MTVNLQSEALNFDLESYIYIYQHGYSNDHHHLLTITTRSASRFSTDAHLRMGQAFSDDRYLVRTRAWSPIYTGRPCYNTIMTRQHSKERIHRLVHRRGLRVTLFPAFACLVVFLRGKRIFFANVYFLENASSFLTSRNLSKMVRFITVSFIIFDIYCIPYKKVKYFRGAASPATAVLFGERTEISCVSGTADWLFECSVALWALFSLDERIVTSRRWLHELYFDDSFL